MKGILWSKITSEQQNEVLMALEESNNPQNLISHDQVKKITGNLLYKYFGKKER